MSGFKYGVILGVYVKFEGSNWSFQKNYKWPYKSGSTISTLLHDKINPKDCHVLSLGDSRFLQLWQTPEIGFHWDEKTLFTGETISPHFQIRDGAHLVEI